jgi:large repetitive protein
MLRSSMSTTVATPPAITVPPQTIAPDGAHRRLVPAPSATSMTVAGAPPRQALHQVTTVDHQGMVIAFARAQDGRDLYYNVLDPQVSTAVDNDEWTGFAKLGFPDELRPAGLGIVTVGDTKGEIEAMAQTPVKAISDEKYVHLFRQSSRHTLLLNRFMLKRIVPPGGSVATPVLEPVWEVRFQRSGKQDVPDGPKDSQSYTTPDGTPFIEPTIELAMIGDLDKGRFDVELLPNQLSTAKRWQFVAVNARTHMLDLYSFPMSEDGLFDLTKAALDDRGQVKPDASITLTLTRPDGGSAPLALAGIPSSTLYTLRERIRVSSGDDVLLKRTARVMLVQPVTASGGTLQLATLDFALGKDGRLARVPAQTTVKPVQPANDALQFSSNAHLTLPDHPSLRLKGSFATEFWFYPGSDITSDQYVFHGAPAVEPKDAAPYVKITKDLQVAAGFGTGSAAVAAHTTSAVVTPQHWVHVAVSYDRTAERGNFTVHINGNQVPVTGGDGPSQPSGQPVTTISGREDGIIGILDGLVIWDTSSGERVAVGDWPFDSVNYEVTPPVTPDSSGNHNDAAVFGAVLVASTAPTGTNTQGNLYVDADGLSAYAGLLDFAHPGDSASVTTGTDGLVHLYFAGVPDHESGGLLSVAQYDTQTSRAVFEDGWTSSVAAGTQNGTVQFTAARSGSYLNGLRIEVRPAGARDLCEVTLDDGYGLKETWRGVPRALDRFMAVLNGASSQDLSDPAVRTGARPFYDNDGSYAASRLPVRSQSSDATLTVLSRYPDVLQLHSASVDEVTDKTCKLNLRFGTPKWPTATTIRQTWHDLPVSAGEMLSVLAGVGKGYNYRKTDSSDAKIYGLTSYDVSNAGHGVLILARPDVHDLSVKIKAGSKPDKCHLTISLTADGPHEFELPDVPRTQIEFAAAVDASAAARYLLLVTDNLIAELRDGTAAPPPERDLRAWTTIVAAFPQAPLAADATITAQAPVPAEKFQRSTQTVDGREKPLAGPSTLVRCTAATQPSNGGTALVDNTADRTGGTADLVTAAVDGGWIRVSPHKALKFEGASAVTVDQAASTGDVLAIAGDMAAEAWCRPGLVTEGAYPRLATYHRLGSTDFPGERIRWAVGLKPAPSLNVAETTAINGSYDLKGKDCTLQISVCPQRDSAAGEVLQLATIGVSKPYVTLAVDASQKVVASYAGGSLTVMSKASLKRGQWQQLTVTLAATGESEVRLRLYLGSVLDGETTGPAASFSKVPGAFRVGSTTSAFPMRANGAFMWARALEPETVALTATAAPAPGDRDLVIAWYLTDGTGTSVKNVAVEGFPFVAAILNPSTPVWAGAGAYALPWAANRDYGLVARQAPLLGGWHHVATAYHTSYALKLGGRDYADCGDGTSLDFGSTFSIESWFTPEQVGSVQTLVSKPGNYQLGLNYTNTVLLTVPTTSDTVGTITLASKTSVRQGQPYYAVATVDSGAVKGAVQRAGQNGSNADPARKSYFLRVKLYVNGVLEATFSKDDYTDPVGIATSSERLNLGRSTAGAAYFTGSLSEVRLWNKELPAEAVAAVWQSHRMPAADGLVSAWRWQESRAKYAYDDNNLNNAVLSSNELWHLYPAASVLTLIVDGQEQTAVSTIDPATAGGYGAEQFTLAASQAAAGELAHQFTGQLSEVRVWRQERTAEQIREDMYRVLTGTETGLAGYWPLNAGSGALADDATGHSNSGRLEPANRPPTWITARAPISNEAKEAYNILGGLLNAYVARIHAIPSVAEYVDTRRDAYGAIYSVMKRCYAVDVTRAVDLYTGFTVGDLDTVYAGQVQTAPSLIGFIEGGPPIPSENQTNPWWNDVNYINTYADTAKVRLTAAQSVNRAFSGSEHTGDSASIEGKVGLFLSTSVGVSVGVGEEVDWEVFTSEGHLGYAGSSDAGSSAERELEFGYQKTTTVTDQLSVGGEWERADDVLNPEVGRRYVPENIGYAVVKSLTADFYLITLKGTNSVVKTTLEPDPNIPEDVNVIDFPIDPRYVKNGTLDGMVGFTPDRSFPDAGQQPSSYFRPLEAYQLKREIEREDQQLEAYYQQFDTANLSQGLSLGAKISPASIDTGFTRFRNQILPAAPSYDWQRGLAKRSLTNTYVWTATGGLHTEQAELSDTYSESYSGASSWEMSNGLEFDLAAAAVVGLYGEFDALFGSSVEVVSVRSKESETGFGLDIDFETDRYLKRPVLDNDGQPVGYTEDDAPGKVSGYRFSSFFIPSSERNFDTFNHLVIDKNWLTNSEDPGAAALRTATTTTNGAWRVLHRVTYVSRVPPPLQPTPASTDAPALVPPANEASNTVLTRLVEHQINAQSPTPEQIGAAVTAVLGLSPSEPGLLARLLPWWTALLEDAQNKRSEAHTTLAALRTDLLAYMIQKYATAAAADGASA